MKRQDARTPGPEAFFNPWRPGVLALLLLVVPGCADAARPSEPGVLTVTETEQTAAFVRNFNPLLDVGNMRWPARHAMYEPLFVHNPMRGEYVPWLAESYQWTDDRL